MTHQPFSSDFTEMMLAGASQTAELPIVFYSTDGDCIEFIVSDESYYAERVDDLLTVYYGQESGEIVGSLLKSVRRFVKAYLKDAPGFAIEVQDGRMRLTHIFTAGMWKRGDGVIQKTYKKLRDFAEHHNTEVEVPVFA